MEKKPSSRETKHEEYITGGTRYHRNTYADVLQWFSEEIYRRILRRGESHFLVRLTRHLDCRSLEEVCAGYHHRSGPGEPVTHAVPRLVRALLVKYLLNLSLRQLEEAIRWNLLVKWFVGYALFEAGPDHTTLERFEL